MFKTVLVYIQKDDSYLMLYRNKKEKDYNKGKWIGIGGHIEVGESKEDAAYREVKEETGLTLLNLEYRGDVIFANEDFEEIMYVFYSNEFEGELIDCNEGELRFIRIDDLDKINMWEGDKYFLDLIKKNESGFLLKLIYEKDKLVSHERIK